MEINKYADFCTALIDCGFSLGGGNAKGIFALIPYGWEEQEHIDSPVKWHTGDPETDPWEWRMRVLEERTDVAYAKLFFRASGYITQMWYPYFLAVRRKGESMADAYASGTVSNMAKRIYEIIAANGPIPYHIIKQIGGFTKVDNAPFERAIVDLQMRLFITMSGRAQKKNQYGESYGWNSTVFMTVEDFWRQRSVQLARIDPAVAYDRIREQVLKLNPDAAEKKIRSFIRG